MNYVTISERELYNALYHNGHITSELHNKLVNHITIHIMKTKTLNELVAEFVTDYRQIAGPNQDQFELDIEAGGRFMNNHPELTNENMPEFIELLAAVTHDEFEGVEEDDE